MLIKDLSFKYNDKIIFDHLSLELNSDITCLMGDSGIGKTTLLKLIGGLLEIQDGQIIKEQQNPSFMFQEDRLLKWLNVKENLMLVSTDENKIDYLLKELDLNPNDKISKLSGGMARRVSLIRALVFDSDLLLLDEPFKGMDENLMKKVAKIIKDENKKTIISSHSLFEAEILNAEIVRI